MGKPVREIESWPVSEVMGWRAFYNLQPFGPWRDNYHSAQVAHIMASAHTPSNKPKPKMSDFMYMDATTRQQQQELQTLAWFESRAK